MNADSIRIETDEDGFHLIVEWDGRNRKRLDVLITDPEALYDTVKAEIGPWLYERDQANRERERRSVLDNSAGKWDALDDPKHPDFHSVHADIWDAREGK